jgi:purine-binding chemotaxis protein CheW
MMEMMQDSLAQHKQGVRRASVPAAAEYLIFRLGGEEYGVDILRVQEIRSYEEPTHIADAPVYLKGVINLRGIIVPIVDLRVKFNLADAQYTGTTVVVVLTLATRIVGVVVDAVNDVLALAQANIRAVPDIGQAADSGFITGIGGAPGENGERMLILVDIEKMMAAVDLGVATAPCATTAALQ